MITIKFLPEDKFYAIKAIYFVHDYHSDFKVLYLLLQELYELVKKKKLYKKRKIEYNIIPKKFLTVKVENLYVNSFILRCIFYRDRKLYFLLREDLGITEPFYYTNLGTRKFSEIFPIIIDFYNFLSNKFNIRNEKIENIISGYVLKYLI